MVGVYLDQQDVLVYDHKHFRSFSSSTAASTAAAAAAAAAASASAKATTCCCSSSSFLSLYCLIKQTMSNNEWDVHKNIFFLLGLI